MSSLRIVAIAATLVTAAALGGCGGGASGSAKATSAPTGPSAPVPTAVSSPGANADASAAPTPTPSVSTTSSPTPLRSDRCTAAVLQPSLVTVGAAAGSVVINLVLTNTGQQRCTLQGWPGVSFVGDGNGTQIGAAGDLDRSSPHGTVTLDPGKTAHAPLRIGRAENYPADTCQPVTADGLRVYAPGETNALFVPTTGLTACRNADLTLIFVQALLPGS